MRKKVVLLCTILTLTGFNLLRAQLPVPAMDESLIPPSPNASSMATFGIIPVSLYEGIPNVSFPIYTIKAGSLSLPISLDYNYNGLKTNEDASWVGLGWNLTAGGSVTRVIQGQVDGSLDAGYNYDDYSPLDSLNSATFIKDVYDSKYDVAADIFIFDFPGHSGKFVYYRDTAYSFPYQKLKIYKPSNDLYIRITDENGIEYTFSDYEVTTTHRVKPTDPIIPDYKSTWHLSKMISANRKDTITFNYDGGYTYVQYGIPFAQTLWKLNSINGYTVAPADSLSNEFDITPRITALALSSIDCNTTNVSFTSASTRHDVSGNSYPSLQSILVLDKVRSKTLKQYTFTYELFQNLAYHPGLGNYERLKLKTFTEAGSPETHPYNFYYINETGNYPIKSTYGIDYWGYYNGHDLNSSLFTSDQEYGTSNFRDPDLAYASYGALDSIVYPTGGSTAFRYELNTWGGGAGTPGPGIRVKKVLSYGDNTITPSLAKSYTYTNGNLFNGNTSSSASDFVKVDAGITYDYTILQAGVGSSFGGLINNSFYYTNVTESDTVGSEIHRTDYEFNSLVNYLTGIDVTQKTDYVYSAITGYKIRSQQNNNIAFQSANIGKSFYSVNVNITSQNTATGYVTYNTGVSSMVSAWKYPVYQQAIYFDDAGNSATTTTNYYFNTNTTNLQETSIQASDGSYSLTKYKYPEDYTSARTGGLVNKHVLTPVIEQQLWRKNSSTDSVMLSGKIVSYDTTLIVPVAEYYLESATPLHTLSAETQTSGLYNKLVSDSNYVARVIRQFDSYGNLSEQNLSSNVNNSYIWAYNHSLPIAEVKNAAANKIAYTSFETNETGNWNYSGATGSGGKTGDYYYQLVSGNITSDTLPVGTYIVSYWSDNSIGTLTGGTITTKVNGESDGTAFWKYYEQQVVLSSAGVVTLSGTSNIDELRLFPKTAQMTTCTYSPGVGISSQCSVNNKISYYQYDLLNRLITVFDQQKNILKTIQYNYKNATSLEEF